MLQQRLIEQFNLVANDEHRSQLCIVISIVAINGSDEVLLDKNDEINLLLGIPETRIPLQCFEKGMVRCALISLPDDLFIYFYLLYYFSVSPSPVRTDQVTNHLLVIQVVWAFALMNKIYAVS